MKTNFSVALIARNEEKTLPRLLESLKDFRDCGGEIILVDTGSTDKTVEVAKQFGCKVETVGDRFKRTISAEEAYKINTKFIQQGEPDIVSADDTLFDYSSARNYAATLASNDMVAMPDCDEVYTKLDLKRTIEQIESGVEQLEYNFVFSHDAEGNELIKFLHSKFYNRTKLKWEGIIHEVLVGDAKRVAVGEDMIKLEHWQNRETSRGHYLKGLALAVLEDESNDRNLHYLARELMYTGRFKSAIAMFEKHVAMKKWPAERSQSQLHIGDCYSHMGDSKSAIHSWVDAFDTAPNRREPLMRIAEYYYKVGSPDHVISYVAAALQIKGDNFYANFQPYYENLPHEWMYWALWKKNELNASKQHFDICFGYQPFNSKYLHDFRFYYNLPKISIVIPTLRAEGFKRLLTSIENLNYPKDKIETIILHDDPRLGVPKRVKEGVEKSTGDWVLYASDDIEFAPDSLMCAFKTAMDNNRYFMAFNSQGEKGVSPDEGNICEHFMIHKKLISKIGEVFDTDFYHVGVDNLLWAKVKKLGHAMWCKRAIVKHHHFAQGAPMDDVHKLAWKEERVKHDRELLAKKLKELNAT